MPNINENQIVRLIMERFRAGGANLVRGIGDDAAVIRPRGSREYWVITTDMLLEDVDFCRAWITPAQLGHKSLAVNLSDLAAMGARPRFFVLALGLAPDISKQWIEAFHRGMATLARRHGIVLIGGDLSRSPLGIQVTATAIGESVGRRLVYRSGGSAGDLVFVTGILGKAASGLALLRQGRSNGRSSGERSALKSHRTPEPRCEAGLWLARSGFPSCMMDLSDGLSVDLPRLCSVSGTGAEIFASQVPVYPDARRWHCDPMDLALHGGEDFELLFAVPSRKAARLERLYPRSFPPLSCIGRLRRRRGVVWAPHPGAPAEPLPVAGFDHFSK